MFKFPKKTVKTDSDGFTPAGREVLDRAKKGKGGNEAEMVMIVTCCVLVFVGGTFYFVRLQRRKQLVMLSSLASA